MASNGNYHIYIHQTREVIHRKVVTVKPSGFGSTNPSGGGSLPKAPSGEDDGGSPKQIPSQVPGASIYNGVVRLAKAQSTGAMVGGVIGVIIAVAKAAEAAQKAAGKMNDYTASATGDYSHAIWYGNLAAGQHAIMHPFSTLWSAQQTEASWYRANQRAEEQRSLLGDSAINTLTKGV